MTSFFASQTLSPDFPGLGALGFFAGQLGFAETVFDGFQRNLHFVADVQLAVHHCVEELGTGDNTFGFQSSMDSDPVIIDIDDHAGDNGTGLHIDGFQTLFKEFGEAFAHVHITCK